MDAKTCVDILDRIEDTIIKIIFGSLVISLICLSIFILREFVLMLINFELTSSTSLLIICLIISLMAIYLKFKSTPYRRNKTDNLGKKLDYVDILKLENSFYYIIDESFNGKLYISSVLFLIFAFTLNIFSLSYFLFSLNRYNQEISQTIMHQITVSIVIILVLISMYIIQTLSYTFKEDRKGLKAYNKYSNKN